MSDWVATDEGMNRGMRRVFLACLVGAGMMTLIAYCWFDASNHRPLEFVELESVGADLFYLDASPIVQRGPATVLVIRFRGQVEFKPFHYQDEGLSEPLTVSEWAEHLSAPVVFNAGQFDEKDRHLGWVKASGQWLSHTQKSKWKGVLLSRPKPIARATRPWATLVDLRETSVAVVDDYEHVLQSMMLTDTKGRVRVRESDKLASRTVLAEDSLGRILLFVTQGAATLADMARWLPTTNLDIVRAMNLDGGFEAQAAIRTSELQRTFLGQYGTRGGIFSVGAGVLKQPLPAVVGVFPFRGD